jgi:hypothetical protein
LAEKVLLISLIATDTFFKWQNIEQLIFQEQNNGKN